MEHIKQEIQQLYAERFFSLTWAANELVFYLEPFIGRRNEDLARLNYPLNNELLTAAIRKAIIVLVEKDGRREAISIEGLRSAPFIWTISCNLVKLRRSYFRESQGKTSLFDIISTLPKK